MPYTYILECCDGSYYVGSTWDLEVRLWEHNNDDWRGAAYTRRRRPVRIVYSEEYELITEAFAREKQLQGWSRAKRRALIEARPHDLPKLSRTAKRVSRGTGDSGFSTRSTTDVPGG